MLYADDLCIVSLSSAGLQKLVSICDEYCASHSITFNVKKYVCMFFKCTVNKHCDKSTVFLSGNQIDFVQEDKYLGVLLNPSMKMSIDVSRQTRKFYAQANMLLRNFRYCSNDSNHSVPICFVVPSGLILHLLVLKNLNAVTTVFCVVCSV